MQRTHFTAGYTLYNCVCDRAVRYGQKKNITIFWKKKSILTQTDMLYSYKCILCEFETYFQRKPIRPFPKSCNMSLEQTWQNTYVYIYYMYMWLIKSNKTTCNQSMWAKRSGSIFHSVCSCECSVIHGQSKRSANVPLTLTGKPNPAQITRSH